MISTASSVINLKEENIHDSLENILVSMEKLRRKNLSNKKIADQENDEYLNLSYKLASIISERKDKVTKSILEKSLDKIKEHPTLILLDCADHSLTYEIDSEFGKLLDRLVILTREHGFVGMHENYHFLNALRYLSVKDTNFEEKIAIYDLIKPVLPKLNDEQKEIVVQRIKESGKIKIQTIDEKIKTLQVTNDSNLKYSIKLAKSLGLDSVSMILPKENINDYLHNSYNYKLELINVETKYDEKTRKRVRKLVKSTRLISDMFIGMMPVKLRRKVANYLSEESKMRVIKSPQDLRPGDIVISKADIRSDWNIVSKGAIGEIDNTGKINRVEWYKSINEEENSSAWEFGAVEYKDKFEFRRNSYNTVNPVTGAFVFHTLGMLGGIGACLYYRTLDPLMVSIACWNLFEIIGKSIFYSKNTTEGSMLLSPLKLFENTLLKEQLEIKISYNTINKDGTDQDDSEKNKSKQLHLSLNSPISHNYLPILQRAIENEGQNKNDDNLIWAITNHNMQGQLIKEQLLGKGSALAREFNDQYVLRDESLALFYNSFTPEDHMGDYNKYTAIACTPGKRQLVTMILKSGMFHFDHKNIAQILSKKDDVEIKAKAVEDAFHPVYIHIAEYKNGIMTAETKLQELYEEK